MDAQLLRAAETGDIHLLKRLVDKDPNLLFRVTTQDNTTLHLAARYGHVAILSEIYSRHPSLLGRLNCKGDSPLHVAARAGQSCAVKFLLNPSKGSSQSAAGEGTSAANLILGLRNKKNCTALLDAVRNGHLDVVVQLIEAGPETLLTTNNAGESPLYVAAENGSLEIVKRLLAASKSSADGIGPKGRTFLHAAVLQGHFNVMEAILGKYPELVGQVDIYGRTPLHCAASLRNLRMVRHLLELDSSAVYRPDNDGRSAIHLASGGGHTAVVREIVSCCPDAGELLDGRGRNILHIAVERDKLSVVEYILENTSFEYLINDQDADGNSPLHLAVINHNLSIVYLLATHNRVETSTVNIEGVTALDIAMADSDPSMKVRKFRILRALRLAGAARGLHHDEIGEIVSHATQPGPGDPVLIESCKSRASTLSLVAILIATVSFAAAFTMPGGFISDGQDRGLATLTNRAALKAFVIADTVAMCSSIIVAFLLIWGATGDYDLLVHTLRFSMELMWIALQSMAVAFVTGVYAMVFKSRWLTIVVCILGCMIPSSVSLVLLSHLLPLPVRWRRANGLALVKLFVLDFTSMIAFDDLDGKSSVWSTLTKLLFWRAP
ncbi:protein ACCELERATED CELL DEATH 6-like [Aristolochia californica]|uniref:protein ACCELERATED CELL DEATH 6-like n=1 Tax=Aristolochia californica TaxID=171875 RepID=UPI0035D7EE2A